jgi:hypothetical protein
MDVDAEGFGHVRPSRLAKNENWDELFLRIGFYRLLWAKIGISRHFVPINAKTQPIARAVLSDGDDEMSICMSVSVIGPMENILSLAHETDVVLYMF